MKLHGYYDEYEYTIYNEGGEEVYRAGNSPYESQTVVSLDYAVSLLDMKNYCTITGTGMAEDMGDEWIGCEYMDSGIGELMP